MLLQKYTPKLRFPEFYDSWKNIRFEDVGTVIRGASPRPKGDPRYYGGTVPRLMVEDVARDGKFVNPITDSLTKEGAQLSRFCPKGTLTIVCSGTAKTVGQASFLARDACIHDGFLALIDVKKSYSQDFLYYLLQKFQENSERMATHGGTFINLTTSILKDFSRGFPSYKEQQKIAEFLSAVDERIVCIEKKKDLLEKYKKGCMQKLFSQEIRFTDDNGNPFPDWEENPLGELCSIFKGKQLNRDDMIENGEFPVINGGMTASGYTDIANEKGQTITISEGGNSCGYVDWQENDFWLGGHCYALHSKDKYALVNRYLFQALKASQEKIMGLRVGSGLPNIQKKDLEKHLIAIPHSGEQKKIAVFLSAIDDKIGLVSEGLSKAKLFKKGLLQQMFV